MNKLLNFHIHSGRNSDGSEIRNVILGIDDTAVLEQTDAFFSLGIHPWYIDQRKIDELLHQMESLAAYAKIKLIGECGLDRSRGVALNVQQGVFEAQIRLACRFNKPVIIHCVKCYSELLEIKKRLSPNVPMIIHGFNSKPQLGKQLLNAGFYFSIGTAILNRSSNAANFLSEIPENRLFLETDDQSNAIEEVYTIAAAIRKTSLNCLKDTIFANWMSLQSGSSL